MFVSSKRLKAILNFTQQDISYIFQKTVSSKCSLFKLLPNNAKVILCTG